MSDPFENENEPGDTLTEISPLVHTLHFSQKLPGIKKNQFDSVAVTEQAFFVQFHAPNPSTDPEGWEKEARKAMAVAAATTFKGLGMGYNIDEDGFVRAIEKTFGTVEQAPSAGPYVAPAAPRAAAPTGGSGGRDLGEGYHARDGQWGPFVSCGDTICKFFKKDQEEGLTIESITLDKAKAMISWKIANPPKPR